ncbi:type I phosphomannose isomerase catalytic subunit, partial [Streptomyces fradiae]|uniref:type I phosphomannose isomerase catalytic subunit n=1 Tax=Streptomyces fradiae TaxID=1906 RepID=UPI0036C25FEC
MDRLHTSVRRYAWGSTTALPDLTGEAPDGTPQAELWMGAHPVAPSLVERAGGGGAPPPGGGPPPPPPPPRAAPPRPAARPARARASEQRD